MSEELPCQDKAAYQTEQTAEAAKVEANWKYGRKGLTTYKCRHCGLYHIASYRDDE